MPQGFESHAGSPIAGALKLKSLHVWRDLPATALYGPALVDEAVAFAATALPLLAFGWKALAR